MNLIVAVDKNFGIGKNGDLLAHLPSDIKYFKEHTLGKVVIMGQKTLESLPGGKPLKDRTSIILTDDPSFKPEGCIIVHSIEEAVSEAEKYGPNDVFVCGGGSVYKQLLPYCDLLYVTKIEGDLDADTFIPNIDLLQDEFYVAYMEPPITEKGYTYSFQIYERIKEDQI